MIARLDCSSGVAGDMLVGALLDAGLPLEKLQRAVGALGLDGVRIGVDRVVRGGLTASQFVVEVEPRPRRHRGLVDLLAIVDRAGLEPRVRTRVERVLTELAEAEAAVHGTTVDRVHFHEVGGDDAIVDIVCACVGLDALGVERLVASPIEVGTGSVATAHGVLPVPAPATARLLGDRPITQTVAGEATTPTGAALIVGWDHRQAEASDGPMRQVTLGYGAGQREVVDRPNVVRVRILEPVGVTAPGASSIARQWVQQLECQVDTATGERLAHVLRRALDAGALDAYVTPILMKKGRPGHLLTAWTDWDREAAVRDVLLEDATTLGVRSQAVERTCLERWSVALASRWGSVQAKAVRLPSGIVLVRPEADEIERLVAAGAGSYAAVEAELQRLAAAD